MQVLPAARRWGDRPGNSGKKDSRRSWPGLARPSRKWTRRALLNEIAGTSPAMTPHWFVLYPAPAVPRAAGSAIIRRPSQIHHPGGPSMPSIHSLRAVLLASAVAAAAPAIATEVTPARLANPEPGNWLTNHRTYDIAALFSAARPDQQGHHTKNFEARLCGGDRRQCGQTKTWNRRRSPRPGSLRR